MDAKSIADLRSKQAFHAHFNEALPIEMNRHRCIKTKTSPTIAEKVL
jgi:hypothetical protein